jgi:hypothetical protein
MRAPQGRTRTLVAGSLGLVLLSLATVFSPVCLLFKESSGPQLPVHKRTGLVFCTPDPLLERVPPPRAAERVATLGCQVHRCSYHRWSYRAIGPQPHPLLLRFSIWLPSVEVRGRWRERGRMGRS